MVQITEAIFADYAAQGTLQPKWRWDLKDEAVYPKLSTLSQHEETDFDFLQRLWAANGLFCWFEHTGDASDPATLGSHTLVIADHNGAFAANAQSRIRFTQPGAVMKEDSITRWHGKRRVGVSTLNTASFDYRSVANHAASGTVGAGHDQPMPLVHSDQPGAYAYETPAEAERLALVYLQSLEARSWRGCRGELLYRRKGRPQHFRRGAVAQPAQQGQEIRGVCQHCSATGWHAGLGRLRQTEH